ncbi:hypothetical protein L7F22_066958 [Adiantum nelumboides]|nr:hypothetical protein [Adiantum nelumboides]
MARRGLKMEAYAWSKVAQRWELQTVGFLASKVRPVHSGTATLKDATSEAIRDWVTNVETTHYILGSVAGPHPYPMLVRDFNAIIGKETRRQAFEKWGGKPDVLVACVGGGSNAMGLFHEFINDDDVRLIGVEAAGFGLNSGKHAATLTKGEVGVLHGALSYLLQDEDGQIIEPHSISAGLDYPGVGPEHSFLKDLGRAEYFSITDEEALCAFERLAKLEGIIPALETSHALAFLEKLCPTLEPGTRVVLNCSGRGDKDVHTAIKHLKATIAVFVALYLIGMWMLSSPSGDEVAPKGEVEESPHTKSDSTDDGLKGGEEKKEPQPFDVEEKKEPKAKPDIEKPVADVQVDHEEVKETGRKYARRAKAFRMQNATNECQIRELMEQVQENTLQSEQLCQMEASRNSLVEKLHGQQSQLRGTKNELETVKLELAGKKVELENEKLAKPTMIQALNANAVKLKNQRGRLSGFVTALDGHKMAVGNERLANRLHWVEGTDSALLETWKSQGLTICWVGVDEKPTLIMSAGDQLRSEAGEAMREMLTGDSLDVANNVQRKLGPIDVPTQLFPENNVELLKQLKATGLTGMVGDGINDAPVLAAVDVAIGYASLWGDVLADVGTCLPVIFNGMLLLERKKDELGCLGLFAFRRKCKSKVCQKDVLLSSEKYVDLEAKPWCPEKMEDNKVSVHSTTLENEYCLSYCATKSCYDVRGANNGMRQRVNNRDACEKDCQCSAIDEGLLVSSDAADVGSDMRDSLLGDSSEGDVERVKYQEQASYAPTHGTVRSQDFSSKEGRHVEVESAPIRHLDEHEDAQDMILQYYNEEWVILKSLARWMSLEEVLGKDFGAWAKTEEADDLVWEDAEDGLETPFFSEKDFKEVFSEMASGENLVNFDSFPSSKFNIIGKVGRLKVCTDAD